MFFKVAAKASARVISHKVKEKAKAPVKSTIKKKKALIENIEKNYSRSARGYQLIREQTESLMELDHARFPTKPAFAADSGVCRLQSPRFARSTVL